MEDLSGEQVIYIANLAFIGVVVFCGSRIVTRFITYFTSKHIQFKIEKQVEKEIQQDITKESLVDKIKKWSIERKKRKEFPMDDYLSNQKNVTEYFK